ncbi:MAG TPA: ATP-binding cassette domain-containing protein [Solirubrobacteraceae bacterium]|nr:ATP-binding cassette domain-containing protein [Solirubrobacteraceae bacterium]
MSAGPNTAQVRGEARDAAPAWGSLRVVAGQADQLDAALAEVVAPAIREAEPPLWFFERGDGRSERALRICLRCGAGDRDGIDRLAARLRELGGGALSVERDARAGDGDAPAPSEPDARLFQVSSALAIDAVRALRDRRERVAFGLLLAALPADVALEPASRPRFWRGELERGDDRIELLEGRAEEHAPDLLATARELHRARRSALDRYQESCGAALRAAEPGERERHVALHVRLTANRLGLGADEQALVALLLADGADARLVDAPPPAPSDGRRPRPTAAGPGADVLRLQRVAAERDGRELLAGVSLAVGEGEALGLLGPDGAAKTSILLIAAGLRPHSQGSVRTLGLDPREQRPALVTQLALVPQDGELAEGVTVRENLELCALTRRAACPVDAVLVKIGLSGAAGQRVGDLERGERRLLAIGCALLSAPRVLLLDDPCAGLSPAEREAIWDLLGTLRATGSTVVLATSALADIAATCDRAALLVAGRAVAVEPPAALAQRLPEQVVTIDVADEPDRAALLDLPEVLAVRVEQHAGHWSVEVTTRQPDVLLGLMRLDPELPDPRPSPAGAPRTLFPSPAPPTAAPAAASAPGERPAAGHDRARLMALGMALGGVPHDEARRELREHVAQAAIDAVLSETYGDEASA